MKTPTDAQMQQAVLDMVSGKAIKMYCPQGHGMCCISPETPNIDEVLRNIACPRCGRPLRRED